MKFGVFLPNGSNGYIPSAGSPVYLPTFEHNKNISVDAEKQGLDFVLSMMKYRGFGGTTGYWDACLESFTLMAAHWELSGEIFERPTHAQWNRGSAMLNLTALLTIWRHPLRN